MQYKYITYITKYFVVPAKFMMTFAIMNECHLFIYYKPEQLLISIVRLKL